LQSANLYELLGVNATATREEIRAAFRKLAKQFHPDKNPHSEAAEKFRQVKEAYEVLMDPVRRKKYDAKRNYTSSYKQRSTNTSQPGQKKTKTYTTTEEDIKRRKYYHENYGKKKQSGHTKTTTYKPEPARYNETKYILITIPIAVALLFFVINFYNDKPVEEVRERVPDVITVLPLEKTVTSDSPYNAWFSSPVIDKDSKSAITVYNLTGYDAVVCLTNKETGKTIRNYYIADNFNLVFEYIPKGEYYLKAYLGKDFNKNKTILHDSVSGAFEQTRQFQMLNKETFKVTGEPSEHYTVELNDADSSSRASEKEFFRR
jgi:curved DNA-binding protein CbpA